MDLQDKLKQLPQKPGVYMMMDSIGNVIYVGKAKNLKRRVSQYFTNQKNRPPKVAEMIRHINTFNYLVTDTELDAFIDECRLIKEIKPMYNKQMKNTSKYIYLMIPDEEYPKVTIVKEKADDGALYFGPFMSLHRVEATVKYLNDFYPIRKCSSPRIVRRVNGCLFRELGTCLGVCTGQVSSDEYKVHVEKIRQLLDGNDSLTVQDLMRRLDQAVKNLEFEKAAKYKEYYAGLRHVIAKQRLVNSLRKNRNRVVFEFIDNEHVKFFLIRGNKLLYGKTFNLKSADIADLKQFLQVIIREKFTSEPRDIVRLTQNDIDEAQIIDSYLKRNRDSIHLFRIPSAQLHRNTLLLEASVDRMIGQITSRNKGLRSFLEIG